MSEEITLIVGVFTVLAMIVVGTLMIIFIAVMIDIWLPHGPQAGPLKRDMQTGETPVLRYFPRGDAKPGTHAGVAHPASPLNDHRIAVSGQPNRAGSSRPILPRCGQAPWKANLSLMLFERRRRFRFR